MWLTPSTFHNVICGCVLFNFVVSLDKSKLMQVVKNGQIRGRVKVVLCSQERLLGANKVTH